MTRIYQIVVLSLIGSFALGLIPASSQEPLSDCSTWFGKALRGWFKETIPIHGTSYYTTRIRCSPKDITRFAAEAKKTDLGLGPILQIKGTLTLDQLPPGLEVVDGAKGAKYMLLLQAYLFSPDGRVLWSQHGFPKEDSWVSDQGGSVEFTLVDSYTGQLEGYTAAVLALGDPIFIGGTSETRVILGVKRYSFTDKGVSTDYVPEKTVVAAPKPGGAKTPASSGKWAGVRLRYEKKTLKGWNYREVVTIPVAERKSIFYSLAEYQDRTGDDEGAYRVVGKRYGLPDEAVRAIVMEGALKVWPTP